MRNVTSALDAEAWTLAFLSKSSKAERLQRKVGSVRACDVSRAFLCGVR